VLWLCVHLIQLIGYRNRLFVVINWARDYFLSDRPVRLILPSAGARAAQASDQGETRPA